MLTRLAALHRNRQNSTPAAVEGSVCCYLVYSQIVYKPQP